MESKKLNCKVIDVNVKTNPRKRNKRDSKEVYIVNKEEETVILQLKNTEFGDLQTIARCKEGDVFSVEDGMQSAKMKMIRRLAQLTRIRIKESIENKKQDIIHLEAAARQQTRLINRMTKRIVSVGTHKSEEAGIASSVDTTFSPEGTCFA
jgi:hypothetical protein